MAPGNRYTSVIYYIVVMAPSHWPVCECLFPNRNHCNASLNYDHYSWFIIRIILNLLCSKIRLESSAIYLYTEFILRCWEKLVCFFYSCFKILYPTLPDLGLDEAVSSVHVLSYPCVRHMLRLQVCVQRPEAAWVCVVSRWCASDCWSARVCVCGGWLLMSAYEV